MLRLADFVVNPHFVSQAARAVHGSLEMQKAVVRLHGSTARARRSLSPRAHSSENLSFFSVFSDMLTPLGISSS